MNDANSTLILILIIATVLIGFFLLIMKHYKQPLQERQKLEKEIDDLKSTKVQFENYLSQLDSDKSIYETLILNLKNEVGELQLTKTNLKNRSNELLVAKNFYEKQIHELKNEISALKSVKIRTNNQIELANKDYEEKFFNAKNDHEEELLKIKMVHESDIINLKSKIITLEKNLDIYSKRVSDLKNEISDLEIKREKIITPPTINAYTVIEPITPPIVEPSGQIKYIGYTPVTNFAQTNEHPNFPYVSMPIAKSVIKFPRKSDSGRMGNRGYKEKDLETYIEYYFKDKSGLQFYNDRFLCISDNTRPYIPDHILIDERNNLNLLIDIEIDEPYSGISRFSTHEKGVDDLRNTYFNDRGWIVIRFAEIQVHTNIKGCCKLIAEVIKSISPGFIIPNDLLNASDLEKVPHWDKVQADKWAIARYRESYLGIDIFIDQNRSEIIKSTESKDEKEVETKVIPTKIIEIEIDEPTRHNVINKYSRDERVKFSIENHIYFIDNNPDVISGTTFVHKFFPKFDAQLKAPFVAIKQGTTTEIILQKWENEGKEAAQFGTDLHIDIERFFDNNNVLANKKEFNFFLNFYRKALNNLELYRTEWRIFDDTMMIAGTVDAVFKKTNGTYVLYDWKRSKEITMKGYPDFYTGITQKGFGVCSNIEDCKFYYYSLQLNLYKKILEDNYLGSNKISEMYFVQLHPDQTDYNLFKVPDMQQIISEMYGSLNETSINGVRVTVRVGRG